MIAFLVGTIEEKYEGVVVLDVNGVGYELCVSNNTLVTLPDLGETVKVLTYLQVKEDGIALYGFATQEEKDVFMKLITVSGIGPKMATTILSGMKLTDLMISIVNEDSNALSKIKGLGKKSAERICLELKDKISSPYMPLVDGPRLEDTIIEDALNDAVATLISLGVNKNEAYRIARSNAGDGASAEEIIMKSLRGLGR